MLFRSLSHPREIVHIGRDKTRETSDISDTEPDTKIMGNRHGSLYNLSPRSAPTLKTSGSVQEMTQTAAEPSQPPSSSPVSSNGNDRPSRPPVMHIPGSIPSSPNTFFAKGSIVGVAPSSQFNRAKPQRSASPRQAIHQPKRQFTGTRQTKKQQYSDSKLAHRSSMCDLIIVGTCKALYDFESRLFILL